MSRSRPPGPVPSGPVPSAVSDVQRRLEVALRSGHMGTYSWDPQTRVGVYDEPLLELYGFSEGEFGGQLGELSVRVHPEDRDQLVAAVQAVLAGGDSLDQEFRVVHPDGRQRWLHSYGQLFHAEDSDAPSLVGVVVDVTAARTAEVAREAAQEAERIAVAAAATSQRRLELLARTAALLDSPMDLHVTLQQVADLAIGELADWCVVDLGAAGSAPQLVAVSHADPGMVALAREVQAKYPPDPDDPSRRAVLSTLDPLFVPVVTAEMLQQGARDAEHLQLLTTLGMTSAIVVPVQASGQAFGLLTLISTHGRRLGPEEVTLAGELGRRAGSALAKVRAYAERDAVAQTLQRSLLPPQLPDIPGARLAAHYAPAAGGTDIGGDFYDLFATGPDRWWLVLGDVCGKGPVAASLTGAIRYMTRAFAIGTDDPGRVLDLVNTALLGQEWDGRFATVVLATFGPRTGEAVVVRLASAGHPQPLHKAGPVTDLLDVGGLPLGLLPNSTWLTVDVALAPQDTLLLYTDGATESRTPSGELLDEAGFRAIVDAAPSDPAGLLTHVVAALGRLAPVQRDDLAMLAFQWLGNH